MTGNRVEYFGLQLRIANRHIADAGLHPAVGWLLAVLAFAGISAVLFIKTPMAPWILVILLPGALSRFSGRERNDLISLLFSSRDRMLIRLIENLSVATPVVAVLAFAGAWIPLGVALGMSAALAGSVFNIRSGTVIPTPFGRWPYEFPAGIRRSWPAVLFAFLLAVMAVVYGNFNLVIFTQLFITVMVIPYYLQADPVQYVWMFSCRPGGFLFRKIRVAAGCSTLLIAPVLVAAGIAFPDRWWVPLLIHGFSLVYLATVILVRYASFPGEAGVPGLIIVALAVSFPPFLLVVIPYLGNRAARRLKPFLP